MYATLAAVRAAGATPAVTDAQITAALDAAKERIDRFTEDTFETTAPLTVRALLSGGTAPLPLRVQSVTSVRFADQPAGSGIADVAPSSYAVRSSAVTGDIDAVQLIGYGLLSASLLDVTYEPVRFGDRSADTPVLVTGIFGWELTPDAVRDAAVQLALIELPATASGGAVNVEGDADLGIAPTVPVLAGTTRTMSPGSSTGSAYADSLLMPYRRRLLRVS